MDFSKPTAEEQDPELSWLKNVYRGGEKQLTLRAIIVGMLIGGVMCLSNLYVFFKAGWSMGVTITACILAFALFELLRAMRLTKNDFTILENNAMASVASAAGYMTGGGNMAAYGALLMITAIRPDPIWMMIWFGVIATMGVFAAIPIKRQLINREKLAFPTGTATAATLQTIHDASHATDGAGQGKNAGKSKAKVLGGAALVAALMAFFRDAKTSWMPFNLPASFPLPFSIAGKAAKDWTFSLKSELILVGAGALMSFRTGWSMLLGAIGCYAVMAPQLLADGKITEVSYKAIVNWTLWPGAAILVASGLTSFLLDYKSIGRTLQGMSRIFSAKKNKSETDPLRDIECPEWWFPAGFILLSPVVVGLMMFLFQIPLWAGIIALPLSVVMGFIAARVTGETDITPTKALGPVTQAIFGFLSPGNITGNIMSANVTGGIGLHAADLLTDLKSGYLLGANPRQQFKAQLFGVVAGALVVVPAFWLIIPDPAMLGTEEWPAPACLVWAGVSKAFSEGLGGMPVGTASATLAGFILGIALALAERFAPRKAIPFIPSPSGLGIALVIPASNAIAIFIGSALAAIFRKIRPMLHESVTIPVASGFIAGESLMGIVIAILVVTGLLHK